MEAKNKIKVIRLSAVPQSLNILLRGQLSFLSNTFEVIGVSSPGPMLDELVQREKIRIIPLPIQRRIAPWADFNALLKLYRLFRLERPDIVHSITPKAGLLSMVAACLAGVPIRLHTFTGLVFPSRRGLLRALLITMDRILCFCATRVYPEGEGVMKDLTRFRITNKPLRILANGNINGIDVGHYHADSVSIEQKTELIRSLGFDGNYFIFIYIGRIVSEKGVNELVAAFSVLTNLMEMARLLIVGDFDDGIDPVDYSTREALISDGRIKFVGYQTDIRPYLAVSHVLVLPSYREGFPNVVLQAGAMGLPSLVTNVNGSNEIITHRYNGLIVEPKQVDALRDAMLLLYDDRDLYKYMQANCRNVIVSKYRQEKVWDALMNEYNNLLTPTFDIH